MPLTDVRFLWGVKQRVLIDSVGVSRRSGTGTFPSPRMVDRKQPFRVRVPE